MPAAATGRHLADHHGRGQSRVVRRLRADRRFGERRRCALGFQPCRTWVDVAATGEAVASLAPDPVSGTSYAAPVVSGLAALIRARFPALTARQVMQRIESTAHHPPAGWDPLVGNGTIDPLAAVSTGMGPPATTPKPPPAAAPAAVSPPTTRSRDTRARDTAVRGAAVCLVALTVALAAGGVRSRLRGARDRVPGD